MRSTPRDDKEVIEDDYVVTRRVTRNTMRSSMKPIKPGVVKRAQDKNNAMSNKVGTKCHAHNRQGKQCGNLAVKGKKVCRMHGANAGRKPIHGLYSKELPAKINKAKEEYLKNKEKLLSHEPLIALLKARLDDFERIVDLAEQSETGNMSGMTPVKALEVFSGVSEAISRIIERHSKAELASKSGVDMETMETAMRNVVQCVSDVLYDELSDVVAERVLSAVVNKMKKKLSGVMPG